MITTNFTLHLGSQGSFQGFAAIFQPNGVVSPQHRRILNILWLAVFVAVWVLVPISFVSRPQHMWEAYEHLWNVDALALALGESLGLYFRTMVYGVVIAGALAFSTVLPVMRPPVFFLTTLRFLSMAGAGMLFMAFLGSGETLSVALMVFYQTIFILKSLVDDIESVEKRFFDHARTIYRKEWLVSYEVLLRGRISHFLKAIVQNQPNGWGMLFIVEGYSTSGGGVGALMARLMHNPQLAKIWAVMIVCVVIGACMDKGSRLAIGKLCVWDSKKSERK